MKLKNFEVVKKDYCVMFNLKNEDFNNCLKCKNLVFSEIKKNFGKPVCLLDKDINSSCVDFIESNSCLKDRLIIIFDKLISKD